MRADTPDGLVYASEAYDFTELRTACPPELKVFVAPIDFQPNIRRSFQPDVLVARKQDIGEKKLVRPPVLAIEVLSPGTALVDLNLKRKAYAESGILAHWGVDPARETIAINELDGAQYVETLSATGEEVLTATAPFPVDIRPADLVL
ncbi:MAG TPA: Uma2 family endonuclease [Phytomonospora sp.]